MYDRRALMAAPHWTQCATDPTRREVMGRAPVGACGRHGRGSHRIRACWNSAVRAGGSAEPPAPGGWQP